MTPKLLCVLVPHTGDPRVDWLTSIVLIQTLTTNTLNITTPYRPKELSMVTNYGALVLAHFLV